MKINQMIEIAENSGFCFGVDRAVKIVYDLIEKGVKTAVYGELIHNADVINDLKNKGVMIINDITEISKNTTLVLRTHGVPKEIYQELEKNNINYIDATCPFVKRIHKIAEKLAKDDYEILIMGNSSHPEITGITSYCGINYHIFSNLDELSAFLIKNFQNCKKRLAIFAQTTYNIIEWFSCTDFLKREFPNIVSYDTICNATFKNQENARELAQKSDIMVIIGGSNSSNTRKLTEICSRYCPSFQIENADFLPKIGCKFTKNTKIGITAGASTPHKIILEVKSKMSEIISNIENMEENFNFEEALNQSLKRIHTGERVKGFVAAINGKEIIVDIGLKQTGYIPLSELGDIDPSDLNVGDSIDVIATKINDAEGIVALSRRKLDEESGFDRLVKAKADGTAVSGVVANVVNGGVLVNASGTRVFIPASLSGVGKDGDLKSLLKKKVNFKIIEINDARRRAVGSIGTAGNAVLDESRKKFWENIQKGDKLTGKVKSFTEYAAFIDLGGVDGMLHVTEMSWSHTSKPEETLKKGDTIEVYVKSFDKDKKKISLTCKREEDNPWINIKYQLGDKVKATVMSIVTFGAFARIEDGIDGLIHISQISPKRITNIGDVLKVGDVVDAWIYAIEADKRRINLSLRGKPPVEADENTESNETVTEETAE